MALKELCSITVSPLFTPRARSKDSNSLDSYERNCLINSRFVAKWSAFSLVLCELLNLESQIFNMQRVPLLGSSSCINASVPANALDGPEILGGWWNIRNATSKRLGVLPLAGSCL